MSQYNAYLRIFGLKSLIPKPRESTYIEGHEGDIPVSEVRITIEDGEVKNKIIKDDKKWYQLSKIRKPINYSYALFVLALVIWPLIYGIVKAIIEKEARYVTSNIFKIMYGFQLVFGYMYYDRKHHIGAVSKANKKYIDWALKLSLLIGAILGIVCVVLLNINVNFNTFSEIRDYLNIFGRFCLSVLMFINIYYSFNIFMINTIIFAAIFVTHSLRIIEFKDKLGRTIRDTGEISIKSIVDEYSQLKSEHTQSVNNTNNMFSSIVITGAVGSYFIAMNFDTHFIGVLTYVDAALFLIITGIYIRSLSRVKYHVSSMQSTVNSIGFIRRFLERTPMEYISGDIYKRVNDNPNDEESERSSSSLGSPPGTHSLKLSDDESNGSESSVGNVNESDEIGEDTEEVVEDVSDLVSSEDLRGVAKIHNHEEGENNTSINDSLRYLEKLSLRTNIRVDETIIVTDWILLNTKLGGAWENFKILGFEIEDENLVKQFIAVVMLFTGLFKLNERLGFK